MIQKEKKKENTLSTKKKSKIEEKKRKNDLDQEKQASFKILFFSFINSHLWVEVSLSGYLVSRVKKIIIPQIQDSLLIAFR